jgi:hypothetical protein
MKAPNKTARLAAVMKACGQPKAVTLWVDPRKDPHFRAAIEANRVMTISQESVGTRKDFGLVGFHRERSAAYWIFPKALDGFEGKRIVGIDYSVLQEPRPTKGSAPLVVVRPKRQPAERPPSRTLPKPSAPPEAAPSPKRLPRFRVTIRCTRFADVSQVVEAGTQREAKEQAVARLQDQKIDYSERTESHAVLRVERIEQDVTASGPGERFRRLRVLPDPVDTSRLDA